VRAFVSATVFIQGRLEVQAIFVASPLPSAKQPLRSADHVAVMMKKQEISVIRRPLMRNHHRQKCISR
jgi:hypothetical protein